MCSASTTVLLGLLDAAAPPLGCEGGGHSKMGGVPDCIPSVALAPPCCGICSSALVHLLQISCPLEGSPFQRLVHVFACAGKSCWGKSESWKVLRSQYLEDIAEQGSKVKQEEECTVTTSDWCDGADDWGEDSEGMESIARHSPGAVPEPFHKETDCAMQFQGLSLRESPVLHHVDHSRDDNSNNNHRDGPDVPRCVPAFRPYYISVVDEADYLGYQDTGHAQKLLQEYQRKEGLALEQLVSESCASGGYEEKYEKSATGKRDRVFHRFMKRISSCPEQLLRYSWNGEPLFLTATSVTAAGVPPCSLCQSRRVFEFQLMPALISALKPFSSRTDVSVEFGTALVFTCEKSCWPPNQPTPLEEYIYVQEDPDQHLFK
ncbi:programmed cell death protein 2-like [Anolis carolinensis]|uniref:programmed cell death protein 2-like n=1 Tax=Anolis carolinensis TaxID=28377 RepID=UPI002F2B896A